MAANESDRKTPAGQPPVGLAGPEAESTSAPGKPATKPLAHVLDEILLVAELEEWGEMTPEQQDAELREAGYDGERLSKKIEAIRAEVYKTPR